MASKSIAKGHLTIVDLNDGRVMNLSIRANVYQQIYCADNSLPFNPDFTTYPLIIQPILTMTGVESTNLLGTTAATVSYKILTSKGTFALESYYKSNEYAIYGYNPDTSAYPLALTIKKNLESEDYIIILVTTTYTESGITYSAYNEVLITKLILGTNTVNILPETPFGDSFYTDMPIIDPATGALAENSTTPSLAMVAHLIRGGVIDDSNVIFEWAKLNTDGTWVAMLDKDYDDVLGNEYLTKDGAGSQHVTASSNCSGCCTLWVKPDAIDNFELYKCTIYDVDSVTGDPKKTKYINTIFTISDRTDPYLVAVTDDTPDKFTVNQTTITVKLRMLRNNEEITSYFKKAGVKVIWSLYTNVKDSDGNTSYTLDETWGTEGFKTTSNTSANIAAENYCNKLVLLKDEINKSANLIFEVYEGD